VVSEPVVEQPGLEEAGLEGVPRRLFPCTPTRLTTWLDCPRRYRFAYVDRPTPPRGAPWAHSSFGSSVHAALGAWWHLPTTGRTPGAAGELLDQGWQDVGYRDDEQSARCRRVARAMVERYAARLDPTDEPPGVERTVAARTAVLALSGRVDRIDRRPSRTRPGGSELVVVDYKTGRHRLGPDEARSSLALAMYVVGTRRTLRAECTRVELHHLPTGEVQAWNHTDESLARHLRRAESIAQEARGAEDDLRSSSVDSTVAEGRFPARPGAQCGWCDFQAVCPAGRAQPRQPSWAAVDDARQA
jgi:RecB family exonuclease